MCRKTLPLLTSLGISLKDLVELSGWHAEELGLIGASIVRQTKLDQSDRINNPFLPVIGDVRAGYWVELDIGQSEDVEYLAVSMDPRYGNFEQYLYQVHGPSIYRLFEDGEYAHCVDAMELGKEPKDGDLVVVERLRNQGSVQELTIKSVKNVNGKTDLHPASNDPKFQQPLRLDPDDTDTTVEIQAYVIG